MIKPGDRVMLMIESPTKLEPRWSQPYDVVAKCGLWCIFRDQRRVLRERHLRHLTKYVGESSPQAEVQLPSSSSNAKRDREEDHSQADTASEGSEGAVRRQPARKTRKQSNYAHHL